MSGVREDGASSKHHAHMIGGDGPNSYGRNSAYQKELLVPAHDLLQQLISKHLDTNNSTHDTFRIADLGCSVGGNTFFAVENMIGAVERRYESDRRRVPEFHVFFNDVIGNDFNTLFKQLPAARTYLAAAAPGSFHGRLFPKESIHLAHCSTALHWLSRSLESSNKGRIHYAGAGREVREAYAAQYKRDMDCFLRARGEELVAGGLMVLILIGYRDGFVLGSDSSIGESFDILGSCLYEMAKMGKIGEEEVDCFNLPFYYPCGAEVEAVIEANGLFSVETLTEMGAPMKGEADPATLVGHMRAVIGVLVEERFGSGVVEELFQLHLNKTIERAREKPFIYESRHREIIHFVLLKRNNPS
ncbi:loganic acid O-methyltransferase-like [Salvia hispanica]|uniref:loganic acid O-methyltransferase-like n=1 Tax=Salvia hispanica TaxID=49212 RepID=UPI0020096B5B|nr:loganic acid O-methyltransferase-like [Salvia hispanica]